MLTFTLDPPFLTMWRTARLRAAHVPFLRTGPSEPERVDVGPSHDPPTARPGPVFHRLFGLRAKVSPTLWNCGPVLGRSLIPLSRRVAPRTSPGDDAGIPLPQHPARVKVTLADGTVAWLADQPEAPIGYPQRWLLVDDGADAGVWPWPRALELERAARQPWRRQYAGAEPVNPGPPPVFRADLGEPARARVACGIPDAAGSRGCRSGWPVRCSASTTTGIRCCYRRSSAPADASGSKHPARPHHV